MPKKILIVEDEIFVAMDIERILDESGYNVTAIAADREAALTVGEQVDIAFIDINLRDGQTGPRIACDLADRHGTKVFYVTANPAQIDPIATTALGYIRKPFSEDAIRAAVALASSPHPITDPGHSEITLFHTERRTSSASHRTERNADRDGKIVFIPVALDGPAKLLLDAHCNQPRPEPGRRSAPSSTAHRVRANRTLPCRQRTK